MRGKDSEPYLGNNLNVEKKEEKPTKETDSKYVPLSDSSLFIPKDTVKTIETHISRVYLTEKFAYKQKKPVNFGFVDYTSLKKRIFFARRELSLNRRTCSGGIYLDLVELRQKKDKVFAGYKGGRLIDVFVRMRRVKSECFLNNILKNYYGSCSEVDSILKKTAKKIYLFHKSARTSKRISKFGDIMLYKANWDDNYKTIRENWEKGTDFKSVPFSSSETPLLFKDGRQAKPAGVVSDLTVDYYSSFLSSPLFSEFSQLRREGGFVRDVHGDLRMEHIAVLDARRVNGICLMDCVEFDERYRCQDIYLDIAFLLMDFEFNGYFYESAVFFGYYKNCFNYKKSIAPFEKYEHFVIPFFKAYKAIVRTKIALLSPGTDSIAKALKYFNLAAFYLELSKKKVVILNCGLSGSGKSSLSTLVSRYFYADMISTDKIRQNLFGDTDKTLKYSADANKKVYEAMLEEGLGEFESKAAEENGGGRSGVIFDATFLKREHRSKIINSFNKKDCIFIFVYSKIYEEKERIILERLNDRPNGGGLTDNFTDYSDADAGVYFNQKNFFEEPSDGEIKEFKDAFPPASGIFVQIDASLELKDRFNELMKNIVEKNIKDFAKRQ